MHGSLGHVWAAANRCRTGREPCIDLFTESPGNGYGVNGIRVGSNIDAINWVRKPRVAVLDQNEAGGETASRSLQETGQQLQPFWSFAIDFSCQKIRRGVLDSRSELSEAPPRLERDLLGAAPRRRCMMQQSVHLADHPSHPADTAGIDGCSDD